MKKFLVPLLLLILAACTQTPTPSDGVQPDLAPLIFGGPGYEGATDLAKHATGVYTVGFTTNTGRADPNDADAFVRKYSSSRSVIWTRKFGTPEPEYASSAASDPSDNVYVAGSISDNSTGGRAAFIRKYRADGQLTWTRQFNDRPTSDIPPVTSVTDVATYGGSAVYAVGETYGKLSGSVGSGYIFVRKYTSSGGVSWTRQFNLSKDECCRDFVGSVAVDGSGNAYVVGGTYNTLRGPNNDLLDTFIRKYSPSGSVVWTRQVNFGVIDYSGAVTVSGSNVYVGVSYISDANSDNEGYDFDFRIIKFSTGGIRAEGWGFVYSSANSNLVSGLSTDRDGNIYFSGNIQALNGEGDADGIVGKLKPSGTRVWSKRVASSGSDRANAVLARTTSEVYVAGSTDGVLGDANRGNIDPFLRRLRGGDGSTVWTEQ